MSDERPVHATVIVVGGGPVGLTFALELAYHGVRSIVLEPRTVVEHSRPRAKTSSARTMELFRRLGVADEIRRRAGLPVSWSQTVRYCTTFTGEDVARMDNVLGLELVGSELAAEAAQQVTQPDVEEALRDAIARDPLIDARFGARATAVIVGDDEVRVTSTDEAGEEHTLVASYVVGADGSRSVVRPAIGARYLGEAGGRPNVNITFRSRELVDLAQPVVHNWILNPAAPGVVGPLDLEGTWWAIATGVESIADDAEAIATVRRLVGQDIDVEVLATDPWQARMLLADSYRRGRGFLIGDAAHQNPPWGGHGFNTGVGDAVNLAFKLAGVVHGWAGPELLESYEAERRPVAQQTIDLAATNMRSLSIDLASPALMVDGPEGDAARSAAGETIAEVKRSEFYSLGLVLGYGYGIDAAAQAPTTDAYTPICAPGNRLPHGRNALGESLYDLLGREFTLLSDASVRGDESLGDDASQRDDAIDAWTRAAATRRIPLASVDVSASGFVSPAPGELLLVRPDQHVAWRGALTDDAGAALDAAVRGFAASE